MIRIKLRKWNQAFGLEGFEDAINRYIICIPEAERLLNISHSDRTFCLDVSRTNPKKKGWKKFTFIKPVDGLHIHLARFMRETLRIYEGLYRLKVKKDLPDTVWVKVSKDN